jgi:hypothetical protein
VLLRGDTKHPVPGRVRKPEDQMTISGLAKSEAWMNLVAAGLTADGADRMVEKADAEGRAITSWAYVFSMPDGSFDIALK